MKPNSLAEQQLPHEELTEYLHYNPDTGVFTNRMWRGGSARKGKQAGHTHMGRWLRIKINGREFMAHRLAWFYVHRRWPEKEIDHIDGNGFNNSIKNLRQANRNVNCSNLQKHRNGHLSGVRKAQYKTKTSWIANIWAAGQVVRIGSFDTQAKAYKAYCKVYKEWNGHLPAAELNQ